ncbi:Alpha/beta hydrolase fold-1 [Amylocystis lapponica]|nr:Alpha/beta hydrolase fold-1 [Amylocystis lapponica]
MAAVHTQTYLFDPRPNYPFLIAAKRYWLDQPGLADDPQALTLVCAHALSVSKECWNPVVDDFFALTRNRGSRVRVRDIWSIEAPNHGDSAVLNEDTLRWGYSSFDWQEYARCVHLFLTGLGTGVDVDFSRRRLVGIGHSWGGVAMTLAATWMPKLTFESVILVEPLILPLPEFWPGWTRLAAFFLNSARKRPDVWPSRDAAFADLMSKKAFSRWDPRAVRIYATEDVRDLPTATYPDQEGVTLKCTKAYEAAVCTPDNPGRTRAYFYLPTLCAAHPVHFIWGAVHDYCPRHVKEHVMAVGAEGKQASAAWVEGAGHLVVQMQPQRLAGALWEALDREPQSGAARSRL